MVRTPCLRFPPAGAPRGDQLVLRPCSLPRLILRSSRSGPASGGGAARSYGLSSAVRVVAAVSRSVSSRRACLWWALIACLLRGRGALVAVPTGPAVQPVHANDSFF